eukprot:TRINITY_DN368_c0_g1_i2.p1 TRINITY_DN368_c0_g1~~TRINITY_DN368_c0_g1_i2.p1  ORF type:complete len:211 (-),score=27.16 TRINITY_DN368_c0_g1_i2:136-768(-)
MSSLHSSVLVLFLAFGALAGSLPRKQLGGPPSEFRKHLLPQPVSAGLNQYSALLSAPLQQTQSDALATSLQLPVDSNSKFAFTVFSDLLDHLDLSLTAPDGGHVWLWLHEIKTDMPLSDDGSVSVPGKTFAFVWPFIQLGVYTLSVKSKPHAPRDVLAAGTQSIAVNLFNYDGVRYVSPLETTGCLPGDRGHGWYWWRARRRRAVVLILV